MFDSFKQKLDLWKAIYSRDKYFTGLVVIAFLLYLLNASISVWGNLTYTHGFFDVVKLYTQGYYSLIGTASFFITFLLNFLTGILLTLLWARANMSSTGSKKNLTFLDYISLFFGVFVPGCPTCGLGLIAIFGVGASFAALPFHGLEILVAAMLIILYSIFLRAFAGTSTGSLQYGQIRRQRR